MDKSNILLNQYTISNTSTASACSDGVKKWNVEDFKKKLKIEIVKKDGHDLEFDLIGVDPSLANAFRRILLSEVPSMAIEKVHLFNNTSIIQDEVLAHRIGLIPLKADPRHFDWKPTSSDGDDKGTEKDTLEFELKIRCRKNPAAPETAVNPDDLFFDHKVFTSSLKWIPKGGQKERLNYNPGPVDDDILIAKMRPGHELEMKLYAYKGIGKDHAKFSPVATAHYRLLPEIRLLRELKGEEAERLQSCFSPGVITLNGPKKVAKVANARYDNCSRNVYRHDDLKDAVAMEKVRDHFIFSIESVGATEPEDLFIQAVSVLEAKCDFFLNELTMKL